jgi:hypothetical protein
MIVGRLRAGTRRLVRLTRVMHRNADVTENIEDAALEDGESGSTESETSAGEIGNLTVIDRTLEIKLWCVSITPLVLRSCPTCR